MNWRKIQAMTFDVGGTLIEPWPSVGHVYAQVATKFGFSEFSSNDLNQRFARAWRNRGAFDYSRAAWRRLVNQTFADAVGREPEMACFDAIYEYFGTGRTWRVFDDVLPALRMLRQSGLRLGIISNWDERLGPLLKELNLAPQFDSIVISHEAGHAKPASEIFHCAAARLGVATEFVLHVGDSASEDVAGAESAGMSSLLLDRAASKAQKGMVPTLEFIPAALEEARSRGSLD